MKIVLVIHHFLPNYSAGAEIYTLRLARWLKSHDYQVEVVCVEAIDRGGPNELQPTLDSYDDIPVWRLTFNLVKAEERWHWSYDNPLLGAWFKTYFQDVRPDLVHFHAGYLIGVSPLEVAVSAGIPTVLTLHDYWYLCPRITLQRGDDSLCLEIPKNPAGCAWCLYLERRRYRIPDHITKGLLGRMYQAFALRSERSQIANRRERILPALAIPGAVIVPSRFLFDLVSPYVGPGRLHLLHHGLNLSPFLAQSRSVSDGVLRVGFIGQIAPHKGVHLLIEAFQKLQTAKLPAELHIYGGVDKRPDYTQRLRQLAGDDPRIYFHGRYDNSQVAEILVNLDVTVVPSVWHEIGPLVMLESLAAGTPVIASPLGNMKDLVHEGKNGLFFAAGDAGSLARQLQRLVDDPHLLSVLRAGIAPVKSQMQEMDELRKIYQSLIEPQVF
jgi:glycosyltransferase involved in cell wall biosynthesis